MDEVKKKLTLGFVLLVLGIFVFIGGFFLLGWSKALLIILGLALVGFGIRTIMVSNTDRRKFLKANGVKIQAKIKYIALEVSALEGFKSAGAQSADFVSFKIVCDGKGINSSNLKEYISSGMILQPDVQIEANSSMDVYVNPKDENDYWLDISKVPVKNYGRFDRPWNVTAVHYRSYDGLNYQKV